MRYKTHHTFLRLIILLLKEHGPSTEFSLLEEDPRMFERMSSRLRSRHSYLTAAPTLATRIVNWIRESALFEGTERATVVHCFLGHGFSSSASDNFFSHFAIRRDWLSLGSSLWRACIVRGLIVERRDFIFSHPIASESLVLSLVSLGANRRVFKVQARMRPQQRI